jgi:hypothetical protein
MPCACTAYPLASAKPYRPATCSPISASRRWTGSIQPASVFRGSPNSGKRACHSARNRPGSHRSGHNRRSVSSSSHWQRSSTVVAWLSTIWYMNWRSPGSSRSYRLSPDQSRRGSSATTTVQIRGSSSRRCITVCPGTGSPTGSLRGRRAPYVPLRGFAFVALVLGYRPPWSIMSLSRSATAVNRLVR